MYVKVLDITIFKSLNFILCSDEGKKNPVLMHCQQYKETQYNLNAEMFTV